MSRKDSRPRGVMVNLIDTEKLTELCKEIITLQFGKAPESEMKVWGDLVVGFDQTKSDWRNQHANLVCSEGVGWDVDEYGLFPVPVYFGHWQEGIVYVSANVVVSMMTGEQIDLADFINDRNKDRLESNFRIWHYRFTRTKESEERWKAENAEIDEDEEELV